MSDDGAGTGSDDETGSGDETDPDPDDQATVDVDAGDSDDAEGGEWEDPFADAGLGRVDGSPFDPTDGEGFDPTDGDRDGDAPLSGIADEMAERRDSAAADAELSELFDSVEIEEIDTEALWEEVMDEGTEAQPGVGGVGAAEAVETGPSATYDEHLVDKHQFCQRCPYFSDPPSVRCTHEGTHILEAVDLGHFRVRDCPMVTDDHLQDVE